MSRLRSLCIMVAGLTLVLAGCARAGQAAAMPVESAPASTPVSGTVPAPTSHTPIPTQPTLPGASIRAVAVAPSAIMRIGVDSYTMVSGGGSVWVGSLPRDDGSGNELPGGLIRVDPAADGFGFVDRQHGAGLASGSGHLWRTAFLDSTVTRYDLATAQRQLQLQLDGPLGIAVDGDTVWVTRHDEGVLTRLDERTGEVRATVRIVDPGDGGPAAVLLAAGGVWVVVPRTREIVGIDPSTNAVAARVPLDLTPCEAGSVAFTDARGADEIWALACVDGAVVRVDPATGRVVATVRLDGNPGVVFAVDGAAWAAVGDHLIRIDPVTSVPTGALALGIPGLEPRAATVAFGSVWIAATDTVVRIPLAAFR